MEPTAPETTLAFPVALPALPPRVPKRGTPLSRRVFGALFRALGWRVTGAFPDAPRFVVIGAPHTSNWDGFYGLLCFAYLGIDARIIAKHSLFWPPLSWLLRFLGVIPVDRERAGGFTKRSIEIFREREQFVLALTPEGTRAGTARWKTGFHRIARQAGVPIVCLAGDYPTRTIDVGLTLWPSEDLEADLERIYAYYEGFRGANPRPLRLPPAPEAPPEADR